VKTLFGAIIAALNLLLNPSNCQVIAANMHGPQKPIPCFTQMAVTIEVPNVAEHVIADVLP
jgi:hypothetical protein